MENEFCYNNLQESEAAITKETCKVEEVSGL